MRFENGYNIFTDKSYMQWLRKFHPYYLPPGEYSYNTGKCIVICFAGFLEILNSENKDNDSAGTSDSDSVEISDSGNPETSQPSSKQSGICGSLDTGDYSHADIHGHDMYR